ncbi:MAG: hypothetical protein HYY18_03575 [Planctomycetes bacterium]|nr:hypothetical protein [Planctomycetota bacterium]
MARGFAIGLFVSAALTLVLCRLLDRGTAAAAAGAAAVAGGSAGSQAASPPEEPAAELARLKSANEVLRKQIEEAKAAAVPAAGGIRPAAVNPWGEFAKKLVAYQQAVKTDPKNAKGGQDIGMGLMSMRAAIAKKFGVSIEDAFFTPEGITALIDAALAEADPPLTDAELAALRSAVAEHAAAWEEIEKGAAGRTRIEQRLERLTRCLEATDALKAALDPGHAETAGSMQTIGFALSSSFTNSFSANGTREEIRTKFAQQWAKAIKLDPSHAAALDPIVEEYMKASDALDAEFQAAAASGQGGSIAVMMRARLAAQAAAQRRIAEAVTLTPEQRAALSEWTTTYLYTQAKPDEGGK